MNESRRVRILNQEYLEQHPEISRKAASELIIARDCPQFNHSLPYTLENFDLHCRKCLYCQQQLQVKGIDYPPETQLDDIPDDIGNKE
jgi:hypothetical protein